MANSEINIRRAVIQLAIGTSAIIQPGKSGPAWTRKYIERFARSKLIGLIIDPIPETNDLLVTRRADLISAARYGEMDDLQAGASHLFEVSPRERVSVRRMATYRNQDGSGRQFACSARPTGILVTRLPVTDEERASMPADPLPARPTKYGLELLASQDQIRLDLARADRQRLRLSVSQYATRNGWRLRCRVQDDGSMLVYHIAGAPLSDSAQPIKQGAIVK